MRVYKIGENCKRRNLNGIVARVEEAKACPAKCGVNAINYPPPESHWKNVELDQGSFVSSFLWAWQSLSVTEALKEALQKEGFEGLAFEPTKIVKDDRPRRDRKKLPLDQIPQFHRVKLLTSIPLHQDFVELYNVRRDCPVCQSLRTDRTLEPYILDGNHLPGTDIFDASWEGELFDGPFCSERAKAFLENYPQTFCNFTQVELRN